MSEILMLIAMCPDTGIYFQLRDMSKSLNTIYTKGFIANTLSQQIVVSATVLFVQTLC